jgi:hypothetical protein
MPMVEVRFSSDFSLPSHSAAPPLPSRSLRLRIDSSNTDIFAPQDSSNYAHPDIEALEVVRQELISREAIIQGNLLALMPLMKCVSRSFPPPPALTRSSTGSPPSSRRLERLSRQRLGRKSSDNINSSSTAFESLVSLSVQRASRPPFARSSRGNSYPTGDKGSVSFAPTSTSPLRRFRRSTRFRRTSRLLPRRGRSNTMRWYSRDDWHERVRLFPLSSSLPPPSTFPSSH